MLMQYSHILKFLLTVPALSISGWAGSIESQPFASASRGSANTLFQRLTPEETGLIVNNAYDDPTMWSKRYREFMGGAMGSGVASGDFDGDGLVDLYVSTKTRPGRLFRNLGNWKFEDVTDKAGLSGAGSVVGWLQQTLGGSKNAIWGQGAVFADVNNDGWLDLYICRNDAPNLLYINQGDGTFKEEGAKRGLDLSDGSVIGAFADYDRDGWLDVFILTNQMDGTEPSGRRDFLYRNTGDGNFVNVTENAGIAGETFGHSATWIDANNDGFPDLYIANDFLGPDHFYLNNRDGTFSNVIHEIVPHIPYSSMGADLGDINNDGFPDLLIADMATTTREKDRRGLAASRSDILRASALEDAPPQYMRSALLLNTGTGTFGEAACWAGVEATDWTWSIRFEDFDNDGWTDLHVTNGMVREANNSDIFARMMRAMTDQQRINVMKQSPRLDESNLAYRNLAGQGFEAVTEPWGLEDIDVSFGAATADFDNDGDLDLVYLNYDGGLSIFRNDVSGQHRIQVRLRGTQSNTFGAGATVLLETDAGLQMKPMVISRGYASGSEMVAHFGLGHATQVHRLVVQWPSGIHQVVENIEVDRSYLIHESADNSHEQAPDLNPLFRSVAKERGTAITDTSELAIPDREQEFIPFRTDRAGPGIAAGDLNGDGLPDLVLGATTGSPRQVLWSKGESFETRVISRAEDNPVEDGPPLLIDFNGNGHRDLIVTKASANQTDWPEGFRPELHLNDGQGQFTYAPDAFPDVAVNTGAACLADVDGDGLLDLFLGGRSIPGYYPQSPQSYLLLREGSQFRDASTALPNEGKIGLVKSAVFRDVDQDGHPDLVVALEWDVVRFFHNQGDGTFKDQTEALGFDSGGRGWWNGIAAADLNGDGRLDFAVGNLGTNTTYRTSVDHPFTLFYGRFSNSGTLHMLEGVPDGGTLYPSRARVDIGLHLPEVLRKYPRNDDYARASLEDIFGKERLEAAKRYEVDQFQSGVFLSQKDGTYQFSPLPSNAQIGPILGWAVCDVNGDGHTDLIATQNTDVAIPHFDGGFGLVLLGRGDGTFDPMHPTRSGIVLHGNGRAILDLPNPANGAPDLFVTRHGGISEHFANQSNSARWLRIQCVGPAPNPTATGARLMGTGSDGSQYYHEIGSGGGWFTQSTLPVAIGIDPKLQWMDLEVFWPDGAVSQQRIDPANGTVVVAHPSLP